MSCADYSVSQTVKILGSGGSARLEVMCDDILKVTCLGPLELGHRMLGLSVVT